MGAGPQLHSSIHSFIHSGGRSSRYPDEQVSPREENEALGGAWPPTSASRARSERLTPPTPPPPPAAEDPTRVPAAVPDGHSGVRAGLPFAAPRAGGARPPAPGPADPETLLSQRGRNTWAPTAPVAGAGIWGSPGGPSPPTPACLTATPRPLGRRPARPELTSSTYLTPDAGDSRAVTRNFHQRP